MPDLKCKNCGTKNSYPAGAAAWLLTYGDMITLMLCFFVYLVSTLAESDGKFQEIIESFKGAYSVLNAGEISGPGMISAKSPMDKPDSVPRQRKLFRGKTENPEANQQSETNKFDKQHDYEEPSKAQKRQEEPEDVVEDELMEEAAQEIVEELQKLDVSMVALNEKRGVILRIQDNVLFDSGSASLRPDAVQILEKISEVIAGIPNEIRIEGHTDDVPIGPSLKRIFPSNWELSAIRAVTVLRHILEKQIDPLRLSAVGYGEYRPVERKPDMTVDQWRAKNRRIDIIIMRQRVITQ